MVFNQYLRILIKRWYLIVLLPILAIAVTAFVSYFILEPQYESGTTLYVINSTLGSDKPAMYEDILISQHLIKDYKELITSRTVTKSTLLKLGIYDMSPNELADNINVSLVNDTQLIKITVRDHDPLRAKQLLSTISEVFMEKAKSLMKISNIDTLDSAEVPENPVSPKPLVNMAIALAAGLMVAVTLVVSIEYLDDRIDSVEDIEKRLGLTVLGTIPSLKIK